METGRLLVIEGLDGSGKATQAELLRAALAEKGGPVEKISFPDYESDSSAPLRMYLAGKLGPAEDVGAYAASSFYAVDRYISYLRHWKKMLLAGHTIIADRYTTSNAVYQMAKLPKRQWEEYLLWLWDYEYEKLALPKPDRVIYLDVPPEVSRALLLTRYGGDESRADLHERDLSYQERCREAALYTASRHGWSVLRCHDGSSLHTVEAVAAMIWDSL